MARKVTNGDGEEEGDISRLHYELSAYGDLLVRATQPIRGQKQILKQLCSDRDELLEKCSVNELRRAIYQPSFLASYQGKKLAAYFIPKIGAEKSWALIKKVITSENTSKIQCANYGEVLLLAWKGSVKECFVKLQEQLERILMDVVYYALQHLRYNKKFMAMLEPLGKARNKQVDAMIYRVFEPNLWRCLKAANESVRYNACCLFLPFYPLVSDDDIDNAEYAVTQQSIIIDLLKDDSYGIRAEACRRTLFILSTHYDTFPLDFIRQCLTQIIDVLSVDNVVSVRIAVYEGMRDFLHCASGLNACDRALKCLYDNKGISDRSEHVRLAAFQLLNALVGHRFIKLSEVVKMNRLVKIFTIEESNLVRKEITKLLLPSYMKPGLSPDEVIRRILVMGKESEEAALSFHHIIVVEKLITVERAAEHAKSLVLAIYKALRSIEGTDGGETDEMMSICSEIPTSETFIEPNEGDKSDKIDIWRSSRLLLSCLVVMWLPLLVFLDDEKYARENEHLRRLLTKLFKFAFVRFRNTTVMEGMMHLGKTLDDWIEGRMVILQELFYSCNLDETKARMYLEAVVNWDFLTLLNYIDNAFDNMKRDMNNGSPPKKREKKQKLPVDAFKRSLMYLDCILKQPDMKHNLEQNYAVYVLKYCMDLTPMRDLALGKIHQTVRNFCDVTLTFEDILHGIRLQYTLAIMVLVSIKKDISEENEILKNVQDDVKWLKEMIMPQFYINSTNEQMNMIIEICETYILLWTQQLKTYDMPVEFKAELCDIDWINNFQQSRGEVRLLLPVLEMLRNLTITVAAKNELADIPLQKLLISALQYLIACSKSEDTNFDPKKSAETWVAICTALSNCRMLSSEILMEQAGIIVNLVLEELLEISENETTVVGLDGPGLEVNEVVDFWVSKVLLKHRLLKCFSLTYLKDQIESGALFKNFAKDDEIRVYEMVVHFLFLVKDSSKKIFGPQTKHNMRKSMDLFEICVSILRKKLELLIEKCENNDVLTKLNSVIQEL